MHPHASILAIEYVLPTQVVSNEMLAQEFPEWSIDKIQQKTGIKKRHIVDNDTCASDLAVLAAKKLFNSGVCSPADIDFILLCTQSPDYLLPTTACLLQERLGIPTRAGALDFNLGCSGYIYGLSLARGLIETEQAQHVLLLTAETYSKYIENTDRVNRTLFGDAATATYVGVKNTKKPLIGPFVFGSNGKGKEHLIVKNRGARALNIDAKAILSMNGPEIFTFTLDVIPKIVDALYKKSQCKPEDIDVYVFHQANLYILEHIRKKIGIPIEKMLISLENTGNTVSSTIPIALYEGVQSGKILPGMHIMLVGFGVGYSWGATIMKVTD